MNFYHLKYFYDSARMKSLTKAAALNRVGQPAITKAIQKLETDLDCSLLLHAQNRFALSEQGEMVYSQCEKIFGVTNELKDRIRSEALPKGEVKFACPSSMAESTFLASAVLSVMKRYPGIQIKLMLGRTDFIREWVHNGSADFGIIVDNVDLSGFEAQSIAKGYFRLIKAPSYKGNWQEDGVMTVEELPEVKKLRHLYEQHHQKPLKVKLEIGSWGVIKKFAMSGIGAGLVPDYMIEEDLRAKRLSLIEPKRLSIPYEIKILRVQDRYLNSRTRLVIEEIRRSTK